MNVKYTTFHVISCANNQIFIQTFSFFRRHEAKVIQALRVKIIRYIQYVFLSKFISLFKLQQTYITVQINLFHKSSVSNSDDETWY